MDKLDKDRITSLKNEIRMAEKLNEEELQPIMWEGISRYTGDWKPSFGQDWDICLNEVYPVVQNSLPAIFIRNPRAFFKPRNKTFIVKKRNPNTGQMEETQADSTKSARTQETVTNYSLVEMKYKNEARRTLWDALLFPHGVLWHGYKGEFGMTEEQSLFIKKDKVFVKHLHPLRFIKDPMVTISNIDEARWVGRIIDVPLNDLLEDDKLDIDKTKIKGFVGFGEKVGKKTQKESIQGKDKSVPFTRPLIDFTSDEFKGSPDSRFVKVYEIFLRPSKKESRSGKNGWILLLTDEQEKPLRVNEWTIKAEGFPGKILQFNEIPSRMFGLSDIDTYKQIADQKNVIINQQIRNAQETGKTWVGISKEANSEEDIQRYVEGGNTILFFESGNPRDRMFVASAGGQASAELYTLDTRIQQNLEDKTGITDLKRGFLRSGEESATSVKMRAAGGSARPAYRQDLMSDFLKESILYINQLNKQFMPIKEAVRTMGTLDIEWSENPTKEELQADVDVELDVISMLPENPESELQALNNTLALMIQGITIPDIKMKLAQEGKMINLSPIIEQILLRQRINNPDVFRNIKPEESEGFVSVKEVREARENVNAALTGQQPPFPPTEQDDHLAKLEIYGTIKQLLEKAGQISDVLEQLIQMQQAMLAEQQEKQATPGQVLKKPGITSQGTWSQAELTNAGS